MPILAVAVLGSVFGLIFYKAIQAMMVSSERSSGGSSSSSPYPIVTTDPGVDTSHRIGEHPCPTNPPPPDGFQAWSGAVSGAVSAWAVHVLNTYPMGTFIQDMVNGQVVAARVEWHTWRGATGETGICIKGVTLFQPAA